MYVVLLNCKGHPQIVLYCKLALAACEKSG